jgi:hypothetical protein
MPDLEVEVMLENHPHLFIVDVESALEAQQLKGSTIKCGVCSHKGKVARVGVPGRKARSPRPIDDKQKSIFEKE